jgi:hypothetical protein
MIEAKHVERLVHAIEKVATKQLSKNWMPLNRITIISLKSYLVGRELGKDERRAGFFHAQILIVSFCDRGRGSENIWILLKQNPVYFTQISFHSRRGVRIDERRSPVYRPPLQFWGNFANSKTPGRIFLGQDKKLLPSWSEAFPQVSAKFLIGKRVVLHLPVQSYPKTVAAFWPVYTPLLTKPPLDFERSQKIVSRLLNGRMATGRALPYHSFFIRFIKKPSKTFVVIQKLIEP